MSRVAVESMGGPASGYHFYINGVDAGLHVVTDMNVGSITTTEPLRIGAAKDRADVIRGFFKGEIDEFAIFKRALASNEIATLYSAGTAGMCKPVCTPRASSLVAWWPGDGNANDIIGANNGVLERGATATVSGKVGQCFSLDGVDDRIRILASPSLNVGAGNGFTIEGWIFLNDSTSGHSVVEWNNDAGVPGVRFWIVAPGSLYADIRDTSSSRHIVAFSPNTIATNVFQHIALSYDKRTGQAKLFLNGRQLVAQNLGIFTPQTSYDVYLGRQIDDIPTSFAGKLDEIAIYNNALSSAEITAIYAASSAGKCLPNTTPAEHSVLFVNVHGESYDADGANFYKTLTTTAAKSTFVNLDANGKVATLIRSNRYDQIWVFDLSSGLDDYPADWQAIGDWFNALTNAAIICDGRTISSYWFGQWQGEGRMLTLNYYENLKRQGGGIMLGTDDDNYVSGINSLNDRIGVERFHGNFNLDFIPIDMASPLMNFPNNLGSRLHDNSSPSQTPFGLQPNGRILYSVAWHSGDTNTPGISSTIRGGVGFRIQITSPANGLQVNEEAPVAFEVGQTDGSPPFSYTWESDRDGMLGTGSALAVSNLSTGPHRITVIGTDAARGADSASILINVVFLTPTVSVALQPGSDTGASNSDNITTNRAPIFEVTINKRGSIEFDSTDDGVADDLRANLQAGTHIFLTPPLTDGRHTVTARFVPLLGSSIQTSLTMVVDSRPPLISNLAVTVTPLPSIVTWNTDEPSTSQSDYGLTTNYGRTTSLNSSFVTQHSVALTGLLPGTQYHFRVLASDLAGNEAESSDQAFSTPLTPDLQVTNLTVSPASLKSGSEVTIAWSDINTGLGQTTASWYDRVVVSNLALGLSLVATNIFFDSVLHGNLGSGGSRSNICRLRLPDGFPGAGTLQFIVTADITNTLIEYNQSGTAEDNNSTITNRNATLAPYPDLLISDISSPATAQPGQPIPITWTIVNQGTADAVGVRSDVVSLSTDSQIGNDQVLQAFDLGRTIPVGQSIVVTQSLILPGGLPGDRYFVIAVNSSNRVFELIPTNNTTISSRPITVLSSDLVVQSVVGPSSAQLGQSLPIAWSVQNVGNATANVNWNDRVYLSTSSNSLSGAEVLATYPAVQTLTRGSLYTNSQSVFLELTSSKPPGIYYLVVAADYSSLQPEANESNNIGFRPINLISPPLPDLAITSITVPSAVFPGQTVPVRWAVTNRGKGIANGGWVESLQLSTDALLGNDQPLTSIAFTNSILVGEFVTRTQQVTFPATSASGELFLLVQVDGQNSIVEEDEANNFAFSTNAISVPSALTLYSSVTQISENSADPNIQATISRNGNLSGSLTVTVTSSDTNKLVAPSTVTISAGQSSAAFNLTLRQDGIVDSDKLVTVTATSAGFIPGMGTITVINTDLPRLSLSVEVPSIPEGFTTPVTVMRDDVSDQELTVTLVSSSPGSLLVPGTVSIPAKSNALTFAVLAIEDTIVQQLRTFTITASAGQHDSASAHLSIVDNDLPAITLELASTNISEGAGILATVGTIRRSTADGQIFVAVGSSDTTAALVPPSIGLDPGQLESTFPIGAVDDFVVDGPQTVTISAIVVDSLAGQPLGNTISQTLVVTDDDGPTLTLSVARKVVPEGRSVATMGTVRRNTPTNPALVVSLASSDTTEATAPVIVTIPSGESSASFDISTVDDGITDGSQRVTISATASGYVDGVDSFVVSDTDLPDLVGSDISAPGSIESEANFSITVRVSNQGLAPTRTNFLTRIYLGTDPLSGKGNLVGEFDTQTTLAAGQFFEQVMALTAPLVLGQYWVTVDTDVGRDVEEIIESNNFKITTTPISVEPAYRATVQIDTQATLPGRPILLRGRALRSASDQPLPGVRVNLNVIFGGTARVITVITDDDGNFAASFTPLPDEAGSFTIIASHPGESNPLNNGQGNTALITLMGMKLEIPNVYQTLVEHETWVGEFTLRNLAETPLTGLHAEITQKPDSISVASLSLERGDALLPNGSNTLAIQLVAENATIPNGEILVRVTSDQGVVEEGRILISINRQQAHLVVSISPLEASMVRGKTRTVEFQLGNAGAAASGPIALLLPQTPWLASPSGQTLLSIPSGGSVTVSLSLNPGSDLPLTVYQGSLVLSSDSSQVSIPFRFRCVSESTADLSVEVVDEFFYYAAGSPKLTNALVRLLDAFSSQEISRGTSDTNGLVLFSPLAEGPYTVEVSAKDHTSYRNTVVLEAGVRNQHQAFLSRQVVTYAWTVEPVTIEERVTISVEATFEANVPIPVIVVSPTLIDLSPLTRLGQTMQVDVKMTNHGLIAWQGVHIGFENHPIYEIKALIQDVGIIAAHSEVTVPLLITYKSEAAFRAAPPCNVYGQVSGYYPCGGRQVTGATTIQGYANCTPSPNPPSRPLSNPHQPQPPNPSQPTTAILPPTPTPVQLSIQPPCSCSVSISGASQSNAGHMVSLTASGNPPGGTYRWSVVGPGVALSQSGSTARLNATSVGTLTVHVNYRPPGVTSAGGSCTADHTVTILFPSGAWPARLQQQLL
jgi:subtilase family serine protease